VRKMIETALPLAALNSSAIADKAKKGHPGNMHLWWNRSPIDSSTALLEAAIKDDPVEAGLSEADRKRLIDELTQVSFGEDNGHLSANTSYPTVCDPFSGFGGLTIAAQRLGLNVDAGDLNSVATLLTKASAEIPAGFVDSKAINPQAENKMYFGAEGLATDVAYYGKQVKEKAFKQLSDSYPQVQTSKEERFTAYSWIWVRTMKCPNPACGCQMPMATSYVLSRTKGHEYWAEPMVSGKQVKFQIHQGVCPKDKETNKHGSNGAKFICPACGQITKDDDVKRAGQAHELHLQLMSVCVQNKQGRFYLNPDEEQINAANRAMSEDAPVGALPNNTRWFSPPGFGMKDYADLYTSRQLLLMTTLCDLVSREMAQITKDAVAAGMSNDGRSLSDGGTGALAYGQAIGVYLALVIGKLANFQSSICTWDNRNGNVRATFTRQAIPMTWVFAEGNPFSTPTGNYDTMLQNVVDSVARLRAHSGTSVAQRNARTMKFPENAILFTELPYYDNVGYADLSDYFYVWLRRCLKDVYPDLFEKVVTSKEELSSIPEHYDGDTSKGINEYRVGIRKMLEHFYENASSNYPSILFFEYGKQDDKAFSQSNESELSPFEDLLNSLIQTGFSVTGIWPIRTEKANTKFETFRVAVVFRKKADSQQGATRRGFINMLKRELPPMLDTAYSFNVNDEDKLVAGLGLGMQLFTEYNKVINADGSEMKIHDALLIIWQEVMDYLNAHAVIADMEEA
jgi:putative DNA methylase